MERLKAFIQRREIHTRWPKVPYIDNSLCKIPTSSTVNTTWFVQFVRMAPSKELTSWIQKKSEKFKSTTPKTIL